MTGLPILQTLLDDGTGTYPTDVTSMTALEKGVTWQRGRQDELSDNQPGTLGLTLENIAGAMTPGAGTSLDQGVRLKYTYPPTAHLNIVPAASAKFSGGTGSWGTANGATIATSALHAPSDANNAAVGGTTVLITWPTGGLPAAQLNLAGLTIGVVYTFSTYVYVASGQPDIKLQVFGVLTGPAISTKNTVTRVSLTFTASATSHFIQIVPSTSTTSGQQAWFSCVMVNAGTVAGEFNTLTSTAYTRWTGRLQSLPTSWPSGGDEFSVIAATATDPLAAMARCTLRSASDMTITAKLLSQGSGSFHPISEPSGASRAHDALHLQPPLIHQVVGGGSVTFGTSLGTPDGATGATLTKIAGLTQGQLVGISSASTTSMRVNFVVNAPAGGLDPATDIQLWALGGGLPLTASAPVWITLTGLGVLKLNGGTISTTIPNFTPGTPHVIGATLTGIGTALWADGVKLATAGGVTVPTGASVVLGDPFNAFSCTIGKLVMGFTLTDPDMAAEQTAMAFDNLGETPVARITRLCGYAGVATGTLDATSATVLGYAGQAGRSALDCLLEVAQSDIGNAYADSAGAVSYIGGLSGMAKTTIDATIDANFTDVGTNVITDMTGVVNDATGTTTVTDNVYRTYDLTSSGAPGNHGTYPQSYTWNVSTDDQVQDRTDWKMNNYSAPHSRVGTLTLDLLTMDPTSVASAIGLDLTDYLRITGMPSQTPGGTTLDAIVEGITETITDTSWTLTVNVVSRTLVGAWVLDDSVWGVLDSTTKLGVG